MGIRTLSRAAVVGGAVIVLAACGSLELRPLATKELRDGVKADRELARKDVEPVKGKITLDEAIARALKYNMERRSRMMEEAIAMNQFDASQYDMLPKLVASAGYRWKDNDTITRSKDSVTGLPSLSNPFISSDRASTLFDLGLTWNLLDFGSSYYGARQNGDRVMIAMERRRKAMHLLIQDVRSAFWRAASAQRLQQRVGETITLAEQALEDSRKSEGERSPVEALRYQRQVLENLRLLEATNQELATARLELSHLMNLPLAFKVEVAEPDEQPNAVILDLPVEKLEDAAMDLNADLREQFHNGRIARDETRRVLLRLFPGLSFNYNIRKSTDSYLVNDHWSEAGAVISFNLFNLLSGPSQMRLADAGVALADQRRMATQMAVLAQVHIARLQYANALDQYRRSQAVADVDGRLDDLLAKRQQAEAQSKLEVVANKTTAILSLLRRYQALAQAHAAASRLQATLGVEPQFDSMQNMSLDQLKQIVGRTLQSWNKGELPGLPAPTTMPSSAAASPENEKPVPFTPPAPLKLTLATRLAGEGEETSAPTPSVGWAERKRNPSITHAATAIAGLDL